MLHSAATSAETAEENLGWDAVADRDGLVIACPDGVLDGFQDTWNAGRCCPPADELPADDVGFLDALVPALRRTDAVGHRVYAVAWPGAGPASGTADPPTDATGFLWARLHPTA